MMRSWTRRNGSNPLGSLSLHPRCGKIRADVNRQIIQDSPYGRGRSAFEILVWFRLGRLSPLRTDSLPLVSKIYWPQNAVRSCTRRNGSNPLGSLSWHPRCGKIRADVNRQIIQDSPYGRGRSAFEILVWFRLGRLRYICGIEPMPAWIGSKYSWKLSK